MIVSAWEGESAVKNVRNIIGATNSKEAAPGTLRNMFGTDGRKNLVHASDSIENGVKEIEFFFTKKEVLNTIRTWK